MSSLSDVRQAECNLDAHFFFLGTVSSIFSCELSGRVVCAFLALPSCWVARYHDTYPTQKLRPITRKWGDQQEKLPSGSSAGERVLADTKHINIHT